MGIKKPTLLVYKISKEEKPLFEEFKSYRRKGDFYNLLYLRLKKYFAGDEEVPPYCSDYSDSDTIRLWFDLENDLDSFVRAQMMLCHYSDEVKAIIKDAVLQFVKDGKVASKPSSLKQYSNAKGKKAPKKIKTSTTQVPKEAPPAQKEVSLIPKLSNLEFDTSKKAVERLDLLGSVLANEADVSSGAEKTVYKWAKLLEGYLEGKPIKPAIKQAFETASENVGMIPVYKDSCPYLKELYVKASAKKEEDGEEPAPDLVVENVQEYLSLEPEEGEKKDFTDSLLSMTQD